MKQENYLEGIYGCLERIEKKVEALPVEGTSPTVENRTISPEGIAELKIRLERLQSVVEKNSSEIAAVRSHTARLSEAGRCLPKRLPGNGKDKGVPAAGQPDHMGGNETAGRENGPAEKRTGAQTGDLPSGKRIQGSGNDSFSTVFGTDRFRLDQLQPVSHEPAFEGCRFEIPSHQDLSAGG